jgi:XTP/dITP diphosphohydrolase
VRLVLASRNEHKLREWRDALPDWEIEPSTATDELVEDGATFVDNARLKARHGRHAVPDDTWVAGEDSGIEVDALGGRPGIESARWTVEPVAQLLAELEGVEERGARYVCEVVALDRNEAELRASGTLEGTIAHEPSGSEGFGYDPIFIPRGESLTVAMLGDRWKAAHSHRSQAARALADILGGTVVASRDGRQPGAG